MGRETVIVGAGIFGVTAALALRGRGYDVTLVDQARTPSRGASSTDVSKMIRMDYGSDTFYQELAEEALDGWDRWNAEWPRPLYHPTGFLVLAREAMRSGGFEFESRKVLLARGHGPERLDSATLARRFPAWNAGRYPDGYVSPRGGWAESGAVVAHLLDRAEASEIRMTTGRVTGLVSEGSRVAGVRMSRGSSPGAAEEVLAAERVVLCSGAWTPVLAPWLADRLRAVAQPVVHVQPAHPEDFRGEHFLPFAADISGTGWYGFPALADGRVKIGHHGPGRAVDPASPGPVPMEHLERLRTFLTDSIPALASAPVVTTRVCMYCDAFDGDLLIGADPDRDGLIVASGGSGHAFKFAPVLGDLIADAVESKSSRWSARFAWRRRGARAVEQARQRTDQDEPT